MPNTTNISKKFILLFIFCSALFSDSQNIVKLEKLSSNNISYINLADFINVHEMRSNYYETKDKIEIIYKKNKIYLSPHLSYIKINDKIYNLLHPVIMKRNQYYVPAQTFYESLTNANLPVKIIKEDKHYVHVVTNIYNIVDLTVKSKQNGLLIQLDTTEKFPIKNISSSISSSNWLNITVLKGELDSLTINQIAKQASIAKIRTVQSKESAQISLLLKQQFDDLDLDISDNSINILLRSAIADNAQKINELRKKWLIDTIVIDAGHGGKDPGAIGNNVQEKTVTLDIAKKLGSLLTRNLGVNVVYTREEDVFIPLWERTKIANSVEGKLFLSIHANSTARSSRTKGYETYLLRPGKSDKATEVVSRENGVIELEQDEHQYTDISNENYILAAMAQNSFMKESEDLAALIQSNLNDMLKNTTKNRGVKQAGFHVLVGATMPNVLIEVGFLSNKSEAQNLNKSYYRRQIAEAIYNAVKDFKEQYEKPSLQR